mmetsp:Transcript_10764/g.15975  ORF Transcript_10764/g.15975 Transcript_10764/m.15975 type:complete len:97 (+) Transcript_10764:284-574(+)
MKADSLAASFLRFLQRPYIWVFVSFLLLLKEFYESYIGYHGAFDSRTLGCIVLLLCGANFQRKRNVINARLAAEERKLRARRPQTATSDTTAAKTS